MADTAFQTLYRQEFINGFEQREALIRKTVTTDGIAKGNSFVFLIADSGGATATTRGVNGLIPARADNLTQQTATLTENHDLVRRTGFNIFASQSDGRRIMQETSMGVLNRTVDNQILTELANSTQATGLTASTASLDMVMFAKTILLNNQVPNDGNISALISPAFHAYLMATTEFANVQYVNDKPFSDMPIMFRWAGINFIEHNNLTGLGTNAEKCYMYHKSAIGHAMDVKSIQALADYDQEQDYSWARATAFMGALVLQNTGIVVITADGSAYA